MPFERLRAAYLTLSFRLTAWNTAVVLLVAISSLVGVREGVRRTLLREFDELLREDTQEIRLLIKQHGVGDERLRGLLEHKAQGHIHHLWFVQIFDDKGKSLFATDDAPPTSQTISSDRKSTIINEPPYRLIQTKITEPNERTLIIHVGSSQEYIHSAVSHVTRTMMLAGAFLVVLAPVGGYWLAGRATSPLIQIISTTAKLHPSNVEERLPVRNTGDELDQLSETINGLLDRIASYVEQSRAFIANAAHELRSPLTAIRSNVEVALNCDRSTEEYVLLLEDMLEECTGLASLVNRLLMLAESDAGRLVRRDQIVRLDRVVRKSAEIFQGVAESQGVTLDYAHLAPVEVAADEQGLQQISQNLIDNAIKFTPSGGRVSIEVTMDYDRDQAVLSVRDTGIGIAADDVPHIFERFYRADRSRHDEFGRRGNGLGLSICHSIVTALGGEILVRSATGGGTLFTVYLPVSNPADVVNRPALTSAARPS